MMPQRRVLPPLLPREKPPPPPTSCALPRRLPPSSLSNDGRLLTRTSAVPGPAVAAAVRVAAAVLPPRAALQGPPMRGDQPPAMLEGRWQGAVPPAEEGASCNQSLLLAVGGFGGYL